MSDSSEDDSDTESSMSSNVEDSTDSSEESDNSSEGSDSSSEGSDSSSEGSDSSSDDENSENTWNWNYNTPKRKLKQFNDKSNILHQDGSKFRPIDAFMLLFTEKLFELICTQTNIYGQQNNKNWTIINISDIKIWIAINILMGYHKLPSYRNYWSKDPNFNVPIVSEAMSRNLFSKILSNIHLVDNKKMPSKTSKNYSKTYKIDNFMQILKHNFQKNYILGEYVSIDESMIKFKGRSSLKQYLPKKPIKRGFKVWTLADSKNGYVYAFEIYLCCRHSSCRQKISAKRIL